MRMKSTGACLALSVTVYVALWILVPRATFLPALISVIDGLLHFAPPFAAAVLTFAGMILMAAPTVAFMAVQIAMVYYFSRLRLTCRGAVAVLFASLAAGSVLGLLIVKQSGVCTKIGRNPNLRETLYVISAYSTILRVPMQLAIISAACSVGYAVSTLVRDRNLLVPVVMFAAYIDFWTVTQGPVSTMLKKVPEVAMAVAAPIPAAGTGVFAPQVLIGPGDFLFMALVFAAAHKLGLNGSRNYWYVFIGMTAGMLAVSFGFLPSLPALIVLAVCVLAANWKHFRFSRQEIISTAIVGLVLLASLPLVWSAIKPSHTHKPPFQRVPTSKSR